ncbi:hypothetical protein SLEP1_g30182 [Rubroshorea leprosula]|uniref:Transmembrane protein n=1 Tax=Rubroshorea leprosula TaxID=152421 RepID=A0AAV5K810_9ROSI|nr:hypothetical protein SLEP1_g30182 [Rubroshorea leprosula]
MKEKSHLNKFWTYGPWPIRFSREAGRRTPFTTHNRATGHPLGAMHQFSLFFHLSVLVVLLVDLAFETHCENGSSH